MVLVDFCLLQEKEGGVVETGLVGGWGLVGLEFLKDSFPFEEVVFVFFYAEAVKHKEGFLLDFLEFLDLAFCVFEALAHLFVFYVGPKGFSVETRERFGALLPSEV